MEAEARTENGRPWASEVAPSGVSVTVGVVAAARAAGKARVRTNELNAATTVRSLAWAPS